MGADFWKALKVSLGRLRKRHRPAKRSIVLLTLTTPTGEQVLISLHPDDPPEAMDALGENAFNRPRQGARAVILAWDQSNNTWTVTTLKTP
jgi:hypothetical protein